MSSNAMLDVAIGLILMYLILSLICTVINEAIATLAGLRARTLRKGITDIVDNADMLKVFDDHGLINSTQAALKGKGPSYLSGRTFAAAILDSFDPDKPVVDYQAVVDSIQKLPSSNIKDALVAATADTGQSLDKLRTNVATWFDSAMDRVSGTYKRWLQLISFGVGLVLAVALNADSYTVARALWSDNSLRSEVVEIAGRIVATTGTEEERLKKLKDYVVATNHKDLRALPIGWTESSARPDYNWTSDWSAWIGKGLGWLFTAFAIMLGAPFWFDILGKFMKLRGAGDKPARAQ